MLFGFTVPSLRDAYALLVPIAENVPLLLTKAEVTIIRIRRSITIEVNSEVGAKGTISLKLTGLISYIWKDPTTSSQYGTFPTLNVMGFVPVNVSTFGLQFLCKVGPTDPLPLLDLAVNGVG